VNYELEVELKRNHCKVKETSPVDAVRIEGLRSYLRHWGCVYLTAREYRRLADAGLSRRQVDWIIEKLLASREVIIYPDRGTVAVQFVGKGEAREGRQ
jgi:hypothetical protein